MIVPSSCSPGFGRNSCASVEACVGDRHHQFLRTKEPKRMKKSLLTMLLVLVIGALVQQLAAQGAAQKQIKDPAEYNSYVNAVGQSNPAQKAQTLEAFLQTYPNSVMKEEALVQLMSAYQQAGDVQKTVDTASRILQVNPNNTVALALLSVYYRAVATQLASQGKDPTQNLDLAMKYGQQGLQALPTMTKQEGMSDADFVTLHNQRGAMFAGAVGYAALAKKDYATAEKDLREAVG